MMQLKFVSFCSPVLNPIQEIAAYEAIWTRYPTVVKVARLFRQFQHDRPFQVA